MKVVRKFINWATQTTLFAVLVTSFLLNGCGGESALKYQEKFFSERAGFRCIDPHRVSLSSRPPFELSLASDKLPLVVHYNSNISSEYPAKILHYSESSWRKIVDEIGFNQPLLDHGEEGDQRIDIYIRGDLTPGVGGYAGFSGFEETTPKADAYGYLVIAENLSDVYVRGVVAHEFFHLVQMSYDWFEHPGFMESTAVWITDHVFDDENFYSRYYAYFNMHPDQSLDFISLADPYQYGAGMWFQYLDERFGNADGKFIRKIWENSIQNDFENEPDFYDGMRVALGGQEQLDLAFREFGEWRYYVAGHSDGKHLQESETWSERVQPFVQKIGSITEGNPLSWTLNLGLQPYSHAFLQVDHVPANLHLLIEINGDQLGETPSGTISTQFLQGHTDERIIVISRTIDDQYDPETSPENRVTLSGTVKLVP